MNNEKTTLAVQVGNRIRQKRHEANLSVQDVENRTGIPRSTIQNYESGIRLAPLKNIKTLAAVLKVSPAWLAMLSDFEGESESLAFSPLSRIGSPDALTSVAFNTSLLESKRLKVNDLVTLKVEDDLLSPEIPKGAEVLIDTSVNSIEKTDIYAIKDISGRIMCLWGRKEIGKDECLIYATNDTHFPPIRITESEKVEIVGRVVTVVMWR
ncbi:helix-turn-helix domain-containing protein [Escherichia coli]|nr:helix-turn-helix domain-containing protein [Escherichia coli]EFJ8793508.1 helix-turn-helix domain-containing protein [Escherichia coli]